MKRLALWMWQAFRLLIAIPLAVAVTLVVYYVTHILNSFLFFGFWIPAAIVTGGFCGPVFLMAAYYVSPWRSKWFVRLAALFGIAWFGLSASAAYSASQTAAWVGAVCTGLSILGGFAWEPDPVPEPPRDPPDVPEMTFRPDLN